MTACAQNGDRALRQALVSTVNDRAPPTKLSDVLIDLDVKEFARENVRPMVRGLFPATEQTAVLEVLSRSIVFPTPDRIETVLHNTPFLSTAWKLSNLYLLGLGVEPLSDDAPKLVGLSEGTKCYVSDAYFHSDSRFEDFLVHDAAHVFHNCKRETIGLSKIRDREWLLEIEFGKRETFAYACEAYSCLVGPVATPASRRRLFTDIESRQVPPDERVDAKDFMQLLRGAVAARVGWKHILRSCAPPPRRRGRPSKRDGS